ncbi:MAG: sigma-54 dependent transcriptional regulator [Ignavibacteria bacterium]|nr:sigma-54 dependent transcriptional regulator [Ignavibacteria bacterium]
MEKILLIDDEIDALESLASWFEELGYDTSKASTGYDGIDMVKKINPDVVISDIQMPDISGLEVLSFVKDYDETIQVIMITAFDDMETTILAMQKGAYDYIAKPLDIKRLEMTVKRALENKSLSQKLELASPTLRTDVDINRLLIGKTPIMREIYKKIGQASANRVTVLIQGESGTGKELIARIIHSSGLTKTEPFVAINCTALPENLLESELFGHVKGAFTDAFKDKKGKFELAGEGTIFLDEISEMSFNLQAKLLRVLQEHEFERVGGESIILLKARVIAATNSDLHKLVSQGKFREDLYYRLSVFSIVSPPLRERREDIEYLVKHFLEKINLTLHKNVRKIPAEVMNMLVKHEWKGNVRELENTLMQAVVLSKGDVLAKENILLRKYSNDYEDLVNSDNIPLEELERLYLRRILDKTNWNVKDACEILKISKATIYRKIEQYNLKQENNTE